MASQQIGDEIVRIIRGDRPYRPPVRLPTTKLSGTVNDVVVSGVGRKIAGVLACFIVLLYAAAVLAAPADARVQVEFAELSKSSIVKKGKVAVEVTAPRRWKVRALARAKGPRKGASSALITERKNTRLTADKPRKLKLKLTDRGTRRLSRCRRQTLIFQLRIKRSPRDRERNRRIRRRATLVSDQSKCQPPEDPPTGPPDPGPPDPSPNSNLDYEVTPADEGHRVNGTPRTYQVSGTGGDTTLAETFDCANVSDSDDEFAFVGAGAAERGSPAGEVEDRSGNQFNVNGSDGCARPVVYEDANGNSKLDLDSDSHPTESYGVGGEVSFEEMGTVNTANAGRCDLLDAAVCLQPFPSDYLTSASETTETGRQINFNTQSMPRNRTETPILPTDYNRADGYSPGSMLITKVPGLETQEAFDQTGLVPIDDLQQWDDPDQPAVVIDANTGERWPIWAEIDSNPADSADVNLLMRPQRNWLEGHRYIVALRNLKQADGSPIEASRAFQLYRDRIVGSDPAIESRRQHMDEILAKLSDAGIERSELYLAWDFTVASADSLAGRMLSIRDDAFAQLGDTDLSDLTIQGDSPIVEITDVEDFTPAQDSKVARRVMGSVTVPCYMDTAGCAPGGEYVIGPGGNPVQIPGNTAPVQFECNIPHSAFEPAADPARPSLYGHGLLGSASEVEAGNVTSMGQENNIIFCATDWAGFSTKDAATIGLILQDLNNFPKLADGSQQGFLNFAYLGRAMIHPDGLGSDPAFQDAAGNSLIDDRRLFYDGNSQGGILGGSFVAIAPDLDRGVLGVPGMNYSTLLRRSTDFTGYAVGEFFGSPDTPLGLYDSYPNELERPLILSLIQMLWDRGEANGYAEHMTTDPLPNTPAHQVLMHVAFGDHQVTNVAAQVQARTIGAKTNAPLDPGRIPGIDPLFGIAQIDAFPYDGSAIVFWDSGPPRTGDEGVTNPPLSNTYPTEARDPHGDPRSTFEARQQKSAFLQIGGQVVDTCGGHACYSHGYSGPPSP